MKASSLKTDANFWYETQERKSQGSFTLHPSFLHNKQARKKYKTSPLTKSQKRSRQWDPLSLLFHPFHNHNNNNQKSLWTKHGSRAVHIIKWTTCCSAYGNKSGKTIPTSNQKVLLCKIMNEWIFDQPDRFPAVSCDVPTHFCTIFRSAGFLLLCFVSIIIFIMNAAAACKQNTKQNFVYT